MPNPKPPAPTRAPDAADEALARNLAAAYIAWKLDIGLASALKRVPAGRPIGEFWLWLAAELERRLAEAEGGAVLTELVEEPRAVQ